MENSEQFTAEEQLYLETKGEEAHDPIVKNGETNTENSENTDLEQVKASNEEQRSDEIEEPSESQEKASKKGGMVPHGALHEEREERKKAQAALAAAQEKIAKYEERMALAQQLSAQESSQQQLPDPNADPIGYMHYELQNLKQQQLQQQQMLAAKSQDEQIQNYLEQSVKRARPAIPDFDKAADFLYHQRSQQLKLLEPNLQQTQIDELIGREIKECVVNAMQRSQDPAQLLYDFAKNSGFNAQPPENDKSVDLIQNQQNAAKTLTSVNGSGSVPKISLEYINSLSDEQFAEWYASPNNKKIFNQLQEK